MAKNKTKTGIWPAKGYTNVHVNQGHYYGHILENQRVAFWSKSFCCIIQTPYINMFIVNPKENLKGNNV